MLEILQNKSLIVGEPSSINDKVIKNLALAMIGLNDPYTASHIQEVADLAKLIADQMGMDADDSEQLVIAGFLHDIGKQAIPGSILSKPGDLTEEEFALVKTHVDIGVQLLEYANVSPPIVRIVSEHHERLDGSGYPYGLIGSEISIPGQVLGVADVISALTSKRTYRLAISNEEMAKILRNSCPHKFDVDIVEAALKCL